MPLFRHLHFSDYDDYDTIPLPNEIPAFLATSVAWCVIEHGKWPGMKEMAPARVLSELPIAIHAAGATLRRLGMKAFPLL